MSGIETALTYAVILFGSLLVVCGLLWVETWWRDRRMRRARLVEKADRDIDMFLRHAFGSLNETSSERFREMRDAARENPDKT